MDDIRIDARMALANYESSVAAFGKEAHFSIKNVHDVRAYIEQLEAALREIEMLHYDSETDFHHDAMKAHDIARAALGEKNGKDAKE